MHHHHVQEEKKSPAKASTQFTHANKNSLQRKKVIFHSVINK